MGDLRSAILDQFTRQASPFAAAPAIKDEAALALVVDFADAGPTDTVLDVACGPGLVACAFARVVRHVTGVDVTPAMLDRARARQTDEALTNVTWALGEAVPLPYRDEAFSIVTSRFALHHLEDPAAAVYEMQRVCRPGGRVVVVDLAPPDAKADAFNAMERLRDPSHVRAMPLAELVDICTRAGLGAPRTTGYRLELELESHMARSFPRPDDVTRLRARLVAAVDDDALGISAFRDGEALRYHYPVAVLVAAKA